jgi:hypothetical protein
VPVHTVLQDFRGHAGYNVSRTQEATSPPPPSCWQTHMDGIMNKRQYPRKLLDPIHIAEMKAIDSATVLAHSGTILNASATGLLIRVHHRALNPELARNQAALETLPGKHVVLHIVEMALDIEGQIVRTHQAAPEWVDIALDLTASAPEYWRECLADLLPGLGETNPGASSGTAAGQ